jgi:hypothetical protein
MDWRLQGQERYLHRVQLTHRSYEPLGSNDHDHCEFCSVKFTTKPEPETMTEGYATADRSRWICGRCFTDFRHQFEWTND